MESLLEPVELNRDTTQTLDEIRSGAENVLYGVDSAQAEENINRYVMTLIEGSGLPNLQVMHYRWFLREMTRMWRTREGRDLAFHLELCIRKWVGLGLEPRTLQFLVCEAHQRLKGCQPLTANSLPPAAESAESADVRSGTEQSVESVKSVDVRSGPAIENRQSSIENGVAAKDAKSEHSIPRSLDPSIPCSSHSIPRSLDPSIPEELS